MRKKELTKRELLTWARAEDRRAKAERKARLDTLAKVMLQKSFNLPDHQMAQIEQIVTAAYGRQRLGL